MYTDPRKFKNYFLKQRANFLSTIWITCNGEAKPDQENLGTFAYFPSNRQGISGKYFPYHK